MNREQGFLVEIKCPNTKDLSVLRRAVSLFRNHFPIEAISSAYLSISKRTLTGESPQKPKRRVVFEGVSLVIRSTSTERVDQLQQKIKELETKSQTPSGGGAAFALLVLAGETLVTPNLTLPQPEFHNHKESVVAAAEVWPEFIHPILGVTIGELAKNVKAQGVVEFLAQGNSLFRADGVGIENPRNPE